MKLLACILLASLFTGCATFRCIDPEDRVSDLGAVLECKNVAKGTKQYLKCMVLTKNETKTVTYKVCK